MESILGVEDYLASVSTEKTQVVMASLLEIINCVMVVGIAALMYPLIKQNSGFLGIGYVGFRVIEASILIAAVLCPLLLVVLSQEYDFVGSGAGAYFETLGVLIKSAREYLTGLLTATFFSLGALLFYYFLYQTKIVPRFIAVWGFIAVPLMLAWNLIEAFGISLSFGIVFGLLIILNEIFLGVWLIAKGFNAEAIDSLFTG
jgi:hypothetical protein